MKFANIVIIICLVMAIIITGATLISYLFFGQPITSDTVLALFGFWGGELLILALRQIFGSDVISQARNQMAEDDDEWNN